ncbi:GyrI-like domain-containing protein [Flammeovirga sp. OC4]|uniref:AraC family transcriptional regulator n=1 Tax=Flammeovirga sp. OC4 TaxID=1382345 RepID=UPI0005C48109|nr:GyrI-like domain-containing protein [Flammeovirga sp. OC4]
MLNTDTKIKKEYKNRIDRVFEFISENIDADLSLNKVAEVACFSPFHFHRIFKFITGETLNEYVTRQRIEKSALDLLHQDEAITTIAYKYGFSDNSSYSRSFKKYFGVSPAGFKKENPYRHSKIRQLKSKIGQEYPDYSKYICIIDHLKKWIFMNAKIEIKETQPFNAAGVTHIGVEGIENAFEKLVKWAIPKGIFNNPKAKMGRMFFDSFKVTAPDKVRMSAFLITEKPFEKEGEVSLLQVNKTKCIVARFEITQDEFEKSWTSLFLWMNENGYKKSTENPFEIYQNDFREHPAQKFIVDFHIPIQ